MADDPLNHPRFVTIGYFMKEMLGYSSRISYYNHVNDPGWPQRVKVADKGKPMLVYDECLAYVKSKLGKRGPKQPPKKRRPGRPVKVPPEPPA